jgi:hypothetical protein
VRHGYLRRAPLRVLVLMALACTSACAHAGGTATLRGHGAVIEVRNDNFDDCVIYLIRSGTPIPLGVAPGLSRRTFSIRQGQLGDGGALVLAAGKRGEPFRRLTSPFDLAPGRIASWIVRSGDRPEQPTVR